MLLEDKVIVVTGGAGLLGQAFCKAIIENGGIAIIGEYDLNRGKEVCLKLNEQYGKGKADAISLDITSKESISNAIKYLHTTYKSIDALVNSAYPRNSNYGRKFEEVAYSDFCENLNLNIGGYFLSSQQFALHFKKQGYGNIINISSIYGVIAPRFEIYDETTMTMPIEYAAIKSALIHLTKYMAKYFKGQNVRFNAISLGGIVDKQPESFLQNYKRFTLNKGMLDNIDINGTLIYLLSDLSQFVNGQNIIVDDGFTL
jgi:NAD(P)-dependent dehydrogenase (short-subunit alcohol dehydrogenase family)